MVCWSNNNKGTVQWLSWVDGKGKLRPGSFGGLEFDFEGSILKDIEEFKANFGTILVGF